VGTGDGEEDGAAGDIRAPILPPATPGPDLSVLSISCGRDDPTTRYVADVAALTCARPHASLDVDRGLVRGGPAWPAAGGEVSRVQKLRSQPRGSRREDTWRRRRQIPPSVLSECLFRTTAAAAKNC
jgi:hypothetical protein